MIIKKVTKSWGVTNGAGANHCLHNDKIIIIIIVLLFYE